MNLYNAHVSKPSKLGRPEVHDQGPLGPIGDMAPVLDSGLIQPSHNVGLMKPSYAPEAHRASLVPRILATNSIFGWIVIPFIFANYVLAKVSQADKKDRNGGIWDISAWIKLP